MSATSASTPIANCWRQCCDSRRQVVAMLHAARKWEFTHYSVIYSQQHYWLSCTRGAVQQSIHDYAHELRLCYPQAEQFIAISGHQQSLHIVLWSNHALIVSMTLSSSDSEQLWLTERLREWTENWEFSDTKVLLTVDHATPISQFVRQHFSTAHWLRNASSNRPYRAAQMRPLTESLPWQRRQRLWLTMGVAGAVALTSLWWFWPQPQLSPPAIQTQEYEIAGIPLAELAQILDYQYQANLIAGWQFQEATLADGQWTILMQATYGTISELQRQTPLAVTAAGASARLETRFVSPITVTPQQLASEQEQTREQLESLLADWHEQINWQSHSAPSSELMQWRDYELEWRPSAAGLDSQLAQALQQLPGQLVAYRWAERQQELTMTIRFYWLPRHIKEVKS